MGETAYPKVERQRFVGRFLEGCTVSDDSGAAKQSCEMVERLVQIRGNQERLEGNHASKHNPLTDESKR